MHNLYKIDTKGKLRFWRIEVQDDTYRTVAGLVDGTPVESEWKVAEPKNVGRANETTGPEQAVLEAEALYRDKQVAGGYTENEDGIPEVQAFEPMLAEKFRDKKKVLDAAFASGLRVFVQPKLDGFRNIMTPGTMVSRSNRPFKSSPHIIEATTSFFDVHDDIVLDGELYNHTYHDDFNKLQSLISRPKPKPEDLAETREKVQYHVYDCYDVSGYLSNFAKRIGFLQAVFHAGLIEAPIILVETIEVKSHEEADAAYGRFLEEGYEGMIYRLDAPYENKRTSSLIKRKEFYDEEYTIIEITEGVGNWAGAAKSIKFAVPESADGVGEAGMKGTYEEMVQVLKDKDLYVGGDATIRFPNKTPDGKPRFGVAVALYQGKRDM